MSLVQRLGAAFLMNERSYKLIIFFRTKAIHQLEYYN